jgi:hypothetical protein
MSGNLSVYIVAGALITGGVLMLSGLDRRIWALISSPARRFRACRADHQAPLFFDDDCFESLPDYLAEAIAETGAPTALISLEVHHPVRAARELHADTAATVIVAPPTEEEVRLARAKREAAYADITAEMPAVREGDVIDVRTGVIHRQKPDIHVTAGTPHRHFKPVCTADDVDAFILDLMADAAEFRARLTAWAASDRLEITAGA